MPRLRNTGSGSVVNVDDVTADRIIRGEFDMGEWERLDDAPTVPTSTEPAEPLGFRLGHLDRVAEAAQLEPEPEPAEPEQPKAAPRRRARN